MSAFVAQSIFAYCFDSCADLPFETEGELRAKGTARTPDILLSSPVAVPVSRKSPNSNDDDEENEWKVICWIDSKALFGDVHTHHISVLPQAESYVHRFGPGLVLYWFGHAQRKRLADCGGDLVIGGWELPLRFLLPTGELILRNDAASVSHCSG